MQAWKRIEPTTVTKVGWRKITSKTFEMVSGETTVFDTVHVDGQEFAGVLGLTPDNQVIIARQFRPGPEKVMDELPGGFIDPGETPEQSARREFLEETGYEPGEMRYLGEFYKDTYLNAKWHAFIAFDCVKKAEQNLEFEEEIEIALISIDTLFDNVKNAKLTDHAIVLLAYTELQKRRNV